MVIVKRHSSPAQLLLSCHALVELASLTFIRREQIPDYWTWVQALSLFTHSSKAFLLAVFEVSITTAAGCVTCLKDVVRSTAGSAIEIMLDATELRLRSATYRGDLDVEALAEPTYKPTDFTK